MTIFFQYLLVQEDVLFTNKHIWEENVITKSFNDDDNDDDDDYDEAAALLSF